jgi:GTP pyrophosphokinase
MLEKELGRSGFDALLKSDPAQLAAERCNYQSVDDLLAGLGYGEVTLNSFVNRLREAVKAKQPLETLSSEASLQDSNQFLAGAVTTPHRHRPTPSKDPILGIEGLVHHIAGCCNPLPGEPIIGSVSLGSRGIAIHRQGCPNLADIPGDRIIPVSWNCSENNSSRQTYPVEVRIEVIDRVGVLKDILSHLSDLQINVHKAQVKTFPGQTAEIDLGLDVRDHAHLDQTFGQIRKMSDVLKIRRVTQGGGEQ